MKTRFSLHLLRIVLVGAVLAEAASLEAASNSDAAAIAAGTALLVPLGVTALTGSNIDVTVEAYVPVNEIRLGSPTALHRLAQESIGTLTTAQAAAINTKIGEKLPALIKGAARIKESITALKAIPPTPTSTVPAVLAVYQSRSDWLDKVVAASQAFQARYRALRDTRGLNSRTLGDLTGMSFHLAQTLEENQAAYPPHLSDVLALRLSLHTQPKTTLIPAVSATSAWNERERFGHLLSVLLPSVLNDGSDAPAIVRDFARLGFDVSVDDLAQLKNKLSPDEALKLFESRSAIEMAIAAADELSATFNALTTSVNLGPLTNEAIQQVFAGDKALLSALLETSSDRWHTLNKASASGQGGDQNIILYFENPLTPVLKSATFDPSEFQAAAAALYKTGLSTAASLYGLPGGTGDAAVGASPYNLPAQTLRKQKLAASRADWRDQQLGALKQIVDTYQLLVTKHVDQAAWKSSPDAAAHGKDAMTETKKLLTTLATKLSPPETQK